jgi:hypothetical protein
MTWDLDLSAQIPLSRTDNPLRLSGVVFYSSARTCLIQPGDDALASSSAQPGCKDNRKGLSVRGIYRLYQIRFNVRSIA